MMDQPRFPPMTRAEMKALGWDECDVIVVSGDAYVDHPSSGAAVIARVLIDAGFRTGIIAQPRWDRTDDFEMLGRPRLCFGVTAGSADSMVSHYSPLKQKRRADAWTPGGKAGRRPNRASIVYCSRLREAFPGVVLVLGGIEASMRRLAHYDYWDDAVRRSILLDAKADIIAYGMAERAIVAIAQAIRNAECGDELHPQIPQVGPIEKKMASDQRPTTNDKRQREQPALDGIPGTVVVRARPPNRDAGLTLPSYEEVKADKQKFLDAFMTWYAESDQPKGKTIAQQHGDRYVIQYPPALPLSQTELDHIYGLPYQRRAHPHYDNLGKIPALETVKFSITSHRGCLGSCSFCALAAHQGRIIQWRSRESILDEARRIAAMPDFKGHITDIGGPTANMYACTCPKLARAEPCRNRACLFPEPCPNLKQDLDRHIDVLEAVRTLPGVRKVSIGTGLRYDLIPREGTKREERYLEELCRYYISGQLRVAPEHVSEPVLKLMRKASYARYQDFMKDFQAVNRRLGLKQYLIPYFISGFPGCTLDDMLELAEHIEHKERFLVRQVQDFTPTPMTPAAAMYHTGIDPFTGGKLYVAKDIRDKKLQRALMQLRDPESGRYVVGVLKKTGQHGALARVQRLLRI